MRKLSFFMSLIALFAVSFSNAQAQNLDVLEKDIVVIGNFTTSSAALGNVIANGTKIIRTDFINTFSKNKSFIVADIFKNQVFKALTLGKLGNSRIIDKDYVSICRQQGAKYIILGDVTEYRRIDSKSSDGNASYKMNIKISMKGFNVETNESIGDEEISLSINTTAREETEAQAAEKIVAKFTDYIEEYYPYETTIVKLGDIKGSKLRTLFIHANNAVGIEIGAKFKVYQIEEVDGVKTKKEIGNLRAIEVRNGEGLTKCRVGKGGESILKAFNEKKVLIVGTI